MKIEKDIEKLWQLYFNYVYSFSVRLSGSKEVAEEVTQETFFRAIESIDVSSSLFIKTVTRKCW